ncbi:hypothetical protein [Candidatus Azobacteroides pseudotrichonymphae]|uniref:hypothetical protein n=1 Tax=Candidatus Azobacteroides pseudotrichonymphae TaxID=511435 RepID=UPI00223C84AC|nr:hypothetical protein [Candidatus Azobacteroides pseudotrichonymphae]
MNLYSYIKPRVREVLLIGETTKLKTEVTYIVSTESTLIESKVDSVETKASLRKTLQETGM